MMSLDLSGRTCGRLKVLDRAGSNKRGHALWRCRCVCGTEILVRGSALNSGGTKSCGCAVIERASRMSVGYLTTHGKRKTKTYQSWVGILARCLNTNNPAYKDYGARGIQVCERWRSFENFLSDMGERPDKCTIDRHPNNDGNYEPTNCRWATYSQQNQNRRSNNIIAFNGKSQCLMSWALELGISHQTISTRLNRGWSVDRAMNEPIHTTKRNRAAAVERLKAQTT